MNKLILALFFSAMVQTLTAQISEQARTAILTVLLSDKVEQRAFFDYDSGTWNGSYQLKGGRYAFIYPDSTFQKIYPGIMAEFSYSVLTDSLLELRKIYRDSLRGVYAKRIIPFGILFTVFTRIEIDSKLCRIDLYTTSLFDRASFKEHYAQVQSTLFKKDGKWVIESCTVKSIAWRKTFEAIQLPKRKGEN